MKFRVTPSVTRRHRAPVRGLAGPAGALRGEALQDPSSAQEGGHPESQGPEVEGGGRDSQRGPHVTLSSVTGTQVFLTTERGDRTKLNLEAAGEL